MVRKLSIQSTAAMNVESLQSESALHPGLSHNAAALFLQTLYVAISATYIGNNQDYCIILSRLLYQDSACNNQVIFFNKCF